MSFCSKMFFHILLFIADFLVFICRKLGQSSILDYIVIHLLERREEDH